MKNALIVQILHFRNVSCVMQIFFTRIFKLKLFGSTVILIVFLMITFRHDGIFIQKKMY